MWIISFTADSFINMSFLFVDLVDLLLSLMVHLIEDVFFCRSRRLNWVVFDGRYSFSVVLFDGRFSSGLLSLRKIRLKSFFYKIAFDGI